jgi:O-antigen/teichoic acid export membrane protein
VAPAIAGSLVGFACVIGVIWIRGPLPALVGAVLAGVLVEYSWVTVISLRNIRDMRPSRTLWSFYLAEAWPLGLATIAATFIQQAPVLALSFLSLESVGLFNAASRIPQQLNLLPLIVRNSTFPVLSEAWASDRVRFRRILDSVLGTSFLIAVPIALLGIGLAEPLVRILFGPAFSGAALPFKVLMAAFAIIFPAILLGEAMIAAGFQKMNLLVSLASVPVMTALLFSLLPRAGAEGAATVVLAIYGFIGAATLITAPRLLHMPISMAPLIFGTLSAALGGTVLLLARDLGTLPAALLAACTSAIAMGMADRSTLKLLWSLQPLGRSRRG